MRPWSYLGDVMENQVIFLPFEQRKRKNDETDNHGNKNKQIIEYPRLIS